MKKNASNKLNLNRETLSELTPNILAGVAGGDNRQEVLCPGPTTRPAPRITTDPTRV